MINAPHHTLESLELPKEAKVEVLFIDLDETLLDGTACNMTDEELEGARLINTTLSLINRAKATNTKIVLLTRNSYRQIERFFKAKPELRELFYDAIGCTSGEKSESISYFLKANQIQPQKAVFVDDLATERQEVEENTEVVRVFHPENTNLALTNQTSNERQKLRVCLSPPHKPHDWRLEPLQA